MPDTEEIDGDVYVSPRYLAGSTAVGDPALEPLLALGFDLRRDDLGNAYVTAPDHRVRLGFLPEGEDDGLWRINAYRDRFGPPAWGVSFNDTAPTEFVTAFTTAFAQAYTAGPDTYLAEPDRKDPELGAFDAVVPLIKNGWKLQQPRWNVLELQPPDGVATCEYTTGRLDPEKELTTLQARWHLQGGPKSGYAHWYATATTHTPIPLVKAITQSVSDPAPLPRWKDAMSSGLRKAAQLTPVTPPADPAPTPLDVRRAVASRRPGMLPAASVPRWSTTTRSATSFPRR
ncbi:DUF317 domain-containing protein [Streptomyces sp. SP17KL33]|uniref:DUF317 domain-containing protein n=1 Tax=Streptomyces sp. SP17KL33 TaxID=3002534 RepID=UPI002E767152|nr:DUF317 domain-containing protein [Streptomyces sp. SP17KL33]MEE1838022.1 DUF317 domain-containing protein [Streptomyces sp. SP17KL33]